MGPEEYIASSSEIFGVARGRMGNGDIKKTKKQTQEINELLTEVAKVQQRHRRGGNNG